MQIIFHLLVYSRRSFTVTLIKYIMTAKLVMCKVWAKKEHASRTLSAALCRTVSVISFGTFLIKNIPLPEAILPLYAHIHWSPEKTRTTDFYKNCIYKVTVLIKFIISAQSLCTPDASNTELKVSPFVQAIKQTSGWPSSRQVLK